MRMLIGFFKFAAVAAVLLAVLVNMVVDGTFAELDKISAPTFEIVNPADLSQSDSAPLDAGVQDAILEAKNRARAGEYRLHASLTRQLLETIPNSPDVRVPSYDRASFGQAWADTDGNGCDTRNDILARDLAAIEKQDECTVQSGVLQDSYTGTEIQFTRGAQTSREVHIDHVVALGWAWKNGAHAWDDEKRLQFANDPLVLRAVDGPANSAKSDLGPGKWLPVESARCGFVTQLTLIVADYDLKIPKDDKDAIARVLEEC